MHLAVFLLRRKRNAYLSFLFPEFTMCIILHIFFSGHHPISGPTASLDLLSIFRWERTVWKKCLLLSFGWNKSSCGWLKYLYIILLAGEFRKLLAAFVAGSTSKSGGLIRKITPTSAELRGPSTTRSQQKLQVRCKQMSSICWRFESMSSMCGHPCFSMCFNRSIWNRPSFTTSPHLSDAL